ncbi:MAG: HAMP domain-containing sensor histidine kinase [Miniphocaeibacter sp.]|uniref:sensor histidine kinase n=1 Tax=Miniphocaeibacter sp. TaxID=3100973 RepID=UPI001823BEF4|nr:HAMP domain-containing histidine kinase [Gallicola sp.]
MERIKGEKLKNIFLKYTIKIVLISILIVLLNLSLITMTIKFGLVYPANEEEANISENIDELKKEDSKPEKILKFPAVYGVFTKDGKYEEGNLENEKLVYETYTEGENAIGQGKYIKAIERGDSLLILVYSFKAKYKNEVLQRYLPNIEALGIILMVVEILLCIYILAYRNSKKISRNFQQTEEIIKNLNIDNLNFSLEESEIYEVNELLKGISYMQENLKNSLKQQWEKEEENKVKMQALMHDIKTPLTVIKGETELLLEEEGENKEDIAYIYENTLKIQKYLEELKNITDENIVDDFKEFDLMEFFNKYFLEIKKLSKYYNKKLIIENDLNGKKYLNYSEERLKRALNNVVVNALERAENTVVLKLNAEGKLIFTILDDGKGFSEEALVRGKEIFYTEDKGRNKNTNSHSGIGLYYSNKVLKEISGEIIIGNNRNKGAIVNIIIPLNA